MKKLILFIILFFILLSGCSKRELSEYEKLHNKILNYGDLSYLCDINVISNKNENSYKIRYDKVDDSTYKSEIIEPKMLAGIITTYNTKKYLQINDDINNDIQGNNVGDIYPNPVMLNNFVKNYLQTEQIFTKDTYDGDNKYHIIKIPLPEDKYHLAVQELIINMKTKMPEKMNVYDKKKNVRMKVVYTCE